MFLVENDRMRLASSIGLSDASLLAIHKDMKVGDCLCGLSAATGEAVISRNSLNDGRHTIKDTANPAHGHVIVPVKAVNKIIGVLCLYLPPDIDIEEREVKLLLSIGNQIGAAIENAKLYEKAKALSLHDSLTGLANRRFMQIQMGRGLDLVKRYGKKLSVIMMDIDHFKKYNDTHGHSAGDSLLVNIANILSKNMRTADHIFRYGGEEFLVMLPETDLATASEVAERMRKAIEKEAGVTISLGVSCYLDHMQDQQDLLDKADKALYQAKSKGRNRVEIA